MLRRTLGAWISGVKRPAQKDSARYRLHVEELMRFRRYVLVHLHVYPALPAGATARLNLPDGTAVALPIEDKGDHSVLLREFIADQPGQPLHESALHLGFGDCEARFERIGKTGVPIDPWDALWAEFCEYGRGCRDLRVLEIGSRLRDDTEANWAQEIFGHPSIRYTGIDILAGPNVDVVGDAHRLSAYFPPDSFDIIFSNWVFEHLIMPWTVAVEMNKVLKNGGIAMINSNHSVALHDFPWDFWRISDSGWLGLFNEFTGFEIVKTALGWPVRLTPMRYHEGFRDHEGGLGFQASGVWARKIDRAQASWAAEAEALLQRLSRPYPLQIKD